MSDHTAVARATRGSRAGVAMRELRVEGCYSVAGYSLDALRGRYTRWPLRARALVLQDPDGNTVAFVTADLWCGSRWLLERVAALTRAGDSGLDVHQIVLLGTHTHTGPGGLNGNSSWALLASEPNGFHEGLAERIAGTLADSVESAWRSARPATVTVGASSLWGVSRNRSLAAFRQNPEARAWNLDPTLPGWNAPAGSPTQKAIDPRVVVLTAWDEHGGRIGLLASFACDATALGQEARAPFYAPDWVGFAATEIERKDDAVALLALSGAGDQTPLPPEDRGRRYRGPRGVGRAAQGEALARFVGERVAEAALQASVAANAPAPIRLRSWYEDWVPANGATVPGVADTALAAWSIGAPGVCGAADGRTAFHELGIEWEGHRLTRPDDGDEQHPKLPVGRVFGWLARRLERVAPSPVHPLHVVQVGSHVFGTVPGGPTVAMALHVEQALMRATGATSASVLGYAGDDGGSFTTGPEYATQHYEGAMTLYGPRAGRHLAERLALLASGAPFVPRQGPSAPFPGGEPPVAEALPPQAGAPVPTAHGGRRTDTGASAFWLWEGGAPAAPPPCELTVMRGMTPLRAVPPRSLLLLAGLSPGVSGWRADFTLPAPGAPDLPTDTWLRVICAPPEPFEAAPVDIDRPLDLPQAAVAASAERDTPLSPAEEEPPSAEEVEALVTAIERDPVGMGRRLWATAHAGPGRPSDADARALSARYLAVLRPDAVERLEGFSLGDVPHLLGKVPRYRHTLPDDFTFPGYLPKEHPVDPNDWHFQEGADARGYLSFNAALYEIGAMKVVPARRPVGARDFTYPLPEPTDGGAPLALAFFADFANGLPAARYIARQIVADRDLAAALHLGDVYYNGSVREFTEHLHEPLAPLYDRVPLYILAGNHDMYGKGSTFHAFLDHKRFVHPTVQQQRGHSWRLANRRVQVMGIDTQWDHNRRVPLDSWEWGQLADWLREGRAAGRFSILCTSMHAWDFGDPRPSALYEDLAPLVKREGLVDLWFWGNVHHAALYRPSVATGPFWSSCIGHGGYPYQRIRRDDAKRSAAPVRWAEYESRYHPWRDAETGAEIRPDMGNNGWCKLLAHADGRIELRYIDWMGNLRHTSTLARARGRILRVS